MAYRALAVPESAAINKWLDQQGLSSIVRCQIWEAFEFFAKKERKAVIDVFNERSPAMSRNSEEKVVANDPDHNLGLTYLGSLENHGSKGFMATVFDGATENGTLTAIDGYALYFGPLEAIPTHLRSERIEFLNSSVRRKELLAYHLENGSLKDPNDLEEVASFLKSQAKKTQLSIAQLGQHF